jgi:hypothetical protein
MLLLEHRDERSDAARGTVDFDHGVEHLAPQPRLPARGVESFLQYFERFLVLALAR